MDETHLTRCCFRCGRSIDADAPEGLCPSCLLAAAAAPEPDTLAGEAPTMLAREPAAAPAGPAQLAEGQAFGAYRIGRLLGRGGMGEVYEAEHVETGRRLALKILRARLDDADDRARFLREGQLAASVSHPHTVYVFGSEDIAGTPAIAMELLPGGTLKDLVDEAGPLSCRDAVAAVLDIIGGLDAAQASGVLHRDIKPSNCFIDADGAVKVGDFGLSISTLARDVQIGGAGFQGTPHFAPPEQLRGEPLDVRADIYAVGATLYFLLSGRTPFEAADLAALFAEITTAAPVPLRDRRPDVPAPLAAVVHRCLARDPRARPASYAELAELLRPFSTADAVPAPPGLRAVAGFVDIVIAGLPVSLANAWTLSGDAGPGTRVNVDPWTWIAVFTYFALLEGVFGASIGKRLFGLRVAAAAGHLSWTRVVLRALIFCAPGLVVAATGLLVGPQALEAYLLAHPAAAVAAGMATPVVILLYFATARRLNGFAAVHDLATGTRVTARSARLERRTEPGAERATPAASAAAPARFRCGPFDALGVVGDAPPGRLLAGFDPLLRRRVWIHAVPAGTPPVAAGRRDVGRMGRLRWLTGRRSPDENWDAYEAPAGEALLARVSGGLEWPVAKAWLVDLVREVAAASADGSLPRLDLDRVWIRHDGHAVLLDYPAPGLDDRSRGTQAAGLAMPVFLSRLAQHVRAGLAARTAGRRRPILMPVSAASLLERWSRGDVGSIEASMRELAAAAAAPDRVPRWRRAVPLALAGAPALVLIGGAVGVLPQFDAAVTPERIEIYSLLEALGPSASNAPAPADREAMEIYIAGRYGDQLRDDRFWSAAPMQGSLRRHRETAERVLRAHPSVPLAAVEAARASIAPSLDRIRSNYERNVRTSLPRVRALLVAALAGVGLGVPLVLGLVSALVVPGGILGRLVGLAVVTADGAAIGRARSVARVLVGWSPALAWFAYLAPSPIDRLLAMPVSPLAPGAIVLGVLAAGAAWAIVTPERGPHDRVTGTWLMPR